jgi:hypothetical protein
MCAASRPRPHPTTVPISTFFCIIQIAKLYIPFRTQEPSGRTVLGVPEDSERNGLQAPAEPAGAEPVSLSRGHAGGRDSSVWPGQAVSTATAVHPPV